MLLWAPSRRSLALCLRPAGRGLSSSSSSSSSAAETAAPSAEVAESAGGDFSAAYARPASAEQSKRKIWTKTVTPWHARPQLVPAERAAVTATEAAQLREWLRGARDETSELQASLREVRSQLQHGHRDGRSLSEARGAQRRWT